ncbi:MAG TPA: hypothetical protein VK488_00335 [Gaiellaceae bacterium]|nr:hypothetical protein [Gaiellaceae bacterium]
MRKVIAIGLAVLATLVIGTFAGAARAASNFDCDEAWSLCAEPSDSIGYNGTYTGHDEPSLLFYSATAGSGNSSIYQLTLPDESRTLPNQQGTGGTWNFQLHPAFWLGMALCDNQSAPEFTHDPCVADSDTNIKDGEDPSQADYIGKHAGTAFLELQFYPPGWAPWPPGVSCDAHKWCAAMAMFSFNRNQNTGENNNGDCLGRVGIEPVNFAFITLSGTPHAPPSPLGATGDTFTPHSSSDLFMNANDKLVVDMHDSGAGLVTVIHDLTTGSVGSMTASAANGFAQVNYDPSASTCTENPYGFHPMYSTSSEHTRVPWAAHSYNVAFSDEIGHFEYCNSVPVEGDVCADPGANDDDVPCFSSAFSLLVRIGGCIGTDNDFDGVPYQPVWPGTNRNHGQDTKFHADPVVFSSPLFNGTQSYNRVAFEADLPRIEAADFGGQCDRNTGENCVNPPPGANFYPIYSTSRPNHNSCFWQIGGPYNPHTTNTFGGNSTAEFGPLLLSLYPNVGFVPLHRYNNFRQILSTNPC